MQETDETEIEKQIRKRLQILMKIEEMLGKTRGNIFAESAAVRSGIWKWHRCEDGKLQMALAAEMWNKEWTQGKTKAGGRGSNEDMELVEAESEQTLNNWERQICL
ncbi:hypothetical protein HNY73_017194 [Argiope bruennichi]|uniref:Uncharacterized protein n=1 Tax=Argiope bruennichi TaxID=94029 RepID=A0A8T0EPT3_ARGBR|nr:hypothetical protein HNY73_017194 [Argiope bruennichi]